MDYSVKTLNPLFMEKLFCGTDPIGKLLLIKKKKNNF
jgi:hypothetical protein